MQFLLLSLLLFVSLVHCGPRAPDKPVPITDISPEDYAHYSSLFPSSLSLLVPPANVTDDVTADATIPIYSSWRCETTNGSPLYRDLTYIAFRQAHLVPKTKNCHPLINQECRLVDRIGTAAVGVCGSNKISYRIPCWVIGWATYHIANNCKWNNKAGGKMMLEEAGGGTLTLYWYNSMH